MSDRTDRPELVLEYDLDAPPEKVWRALSIPAFRERFGMSPSAFRRDRPVQD